MNPNSSYPTIGDLCLALEKGLLTQAEARAIILDWFPSAKSVAQAKWLADETKGDA